MADANVNNAVDQLLQQLQNKGTPAKPENPKEELSKEDVEKFLIEYSSQLIKGTVETVQGLKGYVASAPNAEEVEALAALVNSSAAAIETLNKILINNKNIDAKFKLKTMDIESKKELQTSEIQGKLLMNREELLKKLIDEAKVVDVQVTETQADPSTA